MENSRIDEIMKYLRYYNKTKEEQRPLRDIQRVYDAEQERTMKIATRLQEEQDKLAAATKSYASNDAVNKKLKVQEELKIKAFDAYVVNEANCDKYFNEAKAAKGTRSANDIIVADIEGRLDNDN